MVHGHYLVLLMLACGTLLPAVMLLSVLTCQSAICILFFKGCPKHHKIGEKMPATAKAHSVKLVPIGNAKGVRLPPSLIRKYGLERSLVLEETERGILIRGPESTSRLSWEETYRAMASEDWAEWDTTLLDGIAEDDRAPETL
jgi:antitoxin MazE